MTKPERMTVANVAIGFAVLPILPVYFVFLFVFGTLIGLVDFAAKIGETTRGMRWWR